MNIQRPAVLRLLAAGACAAALVVVLLVLLLGGSNDDGPATGAAAVVPADALAYLHVSLDRGRPAVRQALGLAERFPDYPLGSAAVLTRLGTIAGGGGSVDFASEIQPWLGKELALALLNTASATAGSVIVLDVRDRRRTQAFVARAGAQPIGVYDGVRMLRYPSGNELAFVGHYLVLGQDASVRASIDAGRGRVPSLQASGDYRSAAAAEPADRVLDAYASVAGVRRLLAPQGGVLGAVGALLYQPAMTGVAISLSAASGGARVRIHTALDPALAKLNGGSGAAQFTPTLVDDIPSGALLLLDVTGLDRIAPKVLSAGAAGGVAGQVGPLLSRLGGALAAQGVNVQSITSLFDGESAVAIGPTSTGRAGPPALIIVTRTHNEQQTRSRLAALELPLEQLFPPPRSGSGQAPLFNDRQVAGITVHQLVLAPGLQLDYTVANGLILISTSLRAIGQIITHAHSLPHDSAYHATLGSVPQRLTSLLFLDFSQLLSLGEQTGLVRSSRYRAVRSDLAKIRAVGLDSTRGEADSTAELFLQIQ